MEKSIDFDFVADIYDYYVNVDFDIAWYKKLCSGHESILELMCGTGRVSLPLLDEGYSLTCVDYSGKMLDVFRSKVKDNHSVNLICANVCELKLDRKFDLIFLPFNSFTEITDKSLQKSALKAIYNHLADDGVFFLTFYNSEYRIRSCDGSLKEMGTFSIDSNTAVTVSCRNIVNEKSSIITGTQVYEFYESNQLVERKELPISFDLITESEAIKLIEATGFKIKKMFGDYYGCKYVKDSMFMNFLLTKNVS